MNSTRSSSKRRALAGHPAPVPARIQVTYRYAPAVRAILKKEEQATGVPTYITELVEFQLLENPEMAARATCTAGANALHDAVQPAAVHRQVKIHEHLVGRPRGQMKDSASSFNRLRRREAGRRESDNYALGQHY